MKTAARKLLLLLSLLVATLCPSRVGAAAAGAGAAPSPTTQSPAAQRDLLALGTDELYWSADVVPVNERRGSTLVNSVRTLVRARSTGQAQWREIAPIAAQARDLAHRGNELLVALDDGAWMIVSDDGVRSGIPLPGGVRVLALCGDEDDVWAVGEAPRGQLISIPPPRSAASSHRTTRATTTTSSASTLPATTPAPNPAFPPHEVGLFLLRRGEWIERDVLPGNYHSGDLAGVSMAMIDRRLMLAAAGRDSVVHVWSHAPEGGWDNGAEVAILGDRGEIKLMNLDGQPALWIADGTANAASPGSLYISKQRWGEAIKLASQPKLAGFDRRTLTVALGRMRLLASDGRGQLKEQLYNADGSLSGEPIDAVTIAKPGDDLLTQAFQLLIVVVLIIWMVGSMRQRPAVREAMGRADELYLAPIGRRFVGGLIDLIPLLIGSFLGEQAMRQGMPAGANTPPQLTYDSPAFAWFAAGMGVYLLLTTGMELITRGRSIGKLLTKTRVAALDGSRASVGSLLVRNLLRVVDVILFFPLSFVLFSPLRQRVGDMAGGTIVIRNDAPELEPRPRRGESRGDDADDEQ